MEGNTVDYKKRAGDFLNRAVDSLLPLAAVPFAMIIGAGLLLLFKVNPLLAYQSLLQGAFGDKIGITQTLVKATPLLLVGLGVAIAFRGGVINIGGEGQLIIGALAATAFSVANAAMPRVFLLPVTLIVATLAGTAWGAISGALKAWLGVNEILSTVMMNAIAPLLSNYLLRGPIIDLAEIEAGTRIAQSALLPKAVANTRARRRT